MAINILKYIFIALVFTQCTSSPWISVETRSKATPRHENTLVACDGRFYALGGRGKRPVEVFDPKTSAWTVLADAPVEFNHLQGISYDHEIYVIGAFTGEYPHEKPLPRFLIFNPQTKQWREGAEIPTDRLRGSVGVFTYNSKIYLVCGIKDGHWNGHVSWFDEYDPQSDTWKVLPDAPRVRDHFQAAVIDDKVYLAGGRKSYGAVDSVFQLTIPEVDVYDFKTNRWSTLPEKIPTPRAGTASVVVPPYLVVLNGESGRQKLSHSEVEALDTRTGKWSSLPPQPIGRHGTGAVYYNGRIYVAAGSANAGGGPELSDLWYLEWPSHQK